MKYQPKHNFTAIIPHALCVVLFFFSYVVPAKGFETDNAFLGFIGLPIHNNITREGLSFLRQEIRETLAAQHKIVEGMQTNDWHFDNCGFTEATENINNQYDALVTAIGAGNKDTALSLFGQLLHPIQDFYAHSNWVELGMWGLIDNSLDNWKVLKSFEEHKGVIIIQGSTSYTLTVVDHVVTVDTPSGKRPGLITGVYSNDDNQLCPSNASIEHDPPRIGAGLNKDSHYKAGYLAARTLAVQQTTHEWCRLVSLVKKAYPNGEGLSLLNSWVENQSATASTCPIANPPPSGWKRSDVWDGEQAGPKDSNNRSWRDPQFDDSEWMNIALPDRAIDNIGNNDRYYRAHFTWDGSSSVNLSFTADDGISIYINGQFLGEWGRGWRAAGCVNLNWCGIWDSVDEQNIPESLLNTGDNIIAIDVSNTRLVEGTNAYHLDVSISTPQSNLSDEQQNGLETETAKLNTLANNLSIVAGAATIIQASSASPAYKISAETSSALIWQVSELLDQLTQLSIDPNFTILAEVNNPILSSQPFTLTQGLTQSQVEALTAFAANEEQLIGYLQATLTSLNRAEGARRANDTHWEARQIANAQQLLSLLPPLLDAQPQLFTDLKNALQEGGATSQTFTASAVSEFRGNVVANGLPFWLTKSLIELGASDENRNNIRARVFEQNPQTSIALGGGRYPELLTTPAIAVAIQDIAQTLEGGLVGVQSNVYLPLVGR